MEKTVLQDAETTKPPFNIRAFIGRYGALMFLIVLIAFFSILNPRFLTPFNLFNILRQASIEGMIAIGMTFVILTGGIDLSVGSLLALAGIVAAAVYKGGTGLLDTSVGQTSGVGVAGAVLVACGVGLLCGLTQGFVIRWLKVAPFIVTLGGMSVFRGMTLLVGDGGPVSGFDEQFNWLGKGEFFDTIPVPVIIFLIVTIIAHIILRYTQYGRYIYAVGGNPEAARLSGLNINFLLVSVYMIVGLLAGFGGFLQASRINSAEAIAGQGLELNVIAAVVIGGTSLFGGEGGVFGTAVGAILVRVLYAGLTFLHVSSYVQQIIIGAVIIFAVFFDRYTKSRQS